MRLSANEIGLIAALLGAALLVGGITGHPGFALFGAALVWTVLQFRALRALDDWSRKPLKRPDLLLDSWAEIANRLYRLHRQGRGRTRTALARMGALRSITDALPDAAIILNTNGEIENFNRTAAQLLSLEHRDRGRSLAAIVRQPDFTALIRGRIDSETIEFRSPTNQAKHLEARRTAMGGGRLLILVRDVTQLNRLLTMRQDFVANVSHELRTPLTVIIGYLEALGDEDLDDETLRNLVGKLGAPASRMRALVDDLLLLSRLEASPSPSPKDMTPVGMPGLIQQCAGEAAGLSQGRHSIELDIDSTLDITGIESELHSACSNLLSNAVRYSPDGGTISIAWRLHGINPRFSVLDTGIGIAPDNLSRITERFFRADLARSRVSGGTGLGLAIVKHVLKRHDSELEVKSQLGQGSLFAFEFPSVRRLVETNQPEGV